MESTALTDICQTSLDKDEVMSIAEEYVNFHDEKKGGTVEARKKNYTRMVNDYYDLVTDFYEYGWGQSFHFAPRHKGETFAASIARHEMYLALRLGLAPGMKALDVGCGVGGPMRTIARFSGASIVGVNNNEYQIKRGQAQNERAGLSERCDFMKADFMKLPVKDGTYDAVYAIEATCHAPDKEGIYAEIFRVLKPGHGFAAYEWCVTDRYDAGDAEHRRIKKGIEEGDALPELAHTSEVLGALKKVGFQIVESRDLAFESDPQTPWYLPLAGEGLTGFKMSPAGRWVTDKAVHLLEMAKVAPKGSHAVSTFLQSAATSLIAGGKNGTFTPMFYFHARKPQ